LRGAKPDFSPQRHKERKVYKLCTQWYLVRSVDYGTNCVPNPPYIDYGTA